LIPEAPSLAQVHTDMHLLVVGNSPGQTLMFGHSYPALISDGSVNTSSTSSFEAQSGQPSPEERTRGPRINRPRKVQLAVLSVE